MAGLYIHIPFCASRCIYCGFYSTIDSSVQNRYVDALCREIEILSEKPSIQTIYLGGGTPSQLTNENLYRLFNHIYRVYDVDPSAEVTMECNPDDIIKSMFSDLPVNRVSMGAQTFSNDRLNFIHRRHNAEEVDHAMDIIHDHGIHNVSIDLMFGFPQETLKDWLSDIQHAINLQPEHISAYGLMYEEGTPLYCLLQQGKVKEIDEELSLRMYDLLIQKLTEAGYEHYEISNFALPGFRSRHNSSYWHNIPYIGIGAAAHSYDIKSRRWNIADIKKYMESIEKGELPYEEEVLDEEKQYNDLIVTALRTKEGICLNTLSSVQRDYLLQNSETYIHRGLLAEEDGRLYLTRQGITISNSIMSDLMMV